MEKIGHYSSPYNIGHRALASWDGRPGLLGTRVWIEEKIDGSQFSFQLVGDEVYFRSRRAIVYRHNPGMFKNGVDAVLKLKDLLREGWIYRGEYLSKPKHNTLCYDRVPLNHVVLFDIETEPTHFLSHFERHNEAKRLGFEVPPVFFEGNIKSLEDIKQYLSKDSILGGQVEGVVIKPVGHNLYDQDKKVLMGKMVRQDFKEKNTANWRESQPGKIDFLASLIAKYRSPQRWTKAVQHLREAGELVGEPRDIGKLVKEVPNDILSDSEAEIKQELFDYFWKNNIRRGLVFGLPEWYKEKLATDAFRESDPESIRPEAEEAREPKHFGALEERNQMREVARVLTDQAEEK